MQIAQALCIGLGRLLDLILWLVGVAGYYSQNRIVRLSPNELSVARKDLAAQATADFCSRRADNFCVTRKVVAICEWPLHRILAPRTAGIDAPSRLHPPSDG